MTAPAKAPSRDDVLFAALSAAKVAMQRGEDLLERIAELEQRVADLDGRETKR